MTKLRPIRVTSNYLKHPEGSCLFQMGSTKVVCTASISDDVPDHAKEAAKGWLSAEYSMLPRATTTRSSRGRIASGGRTKEISRLIGRIPLGQIAFDHRRVLARVDVRGRGDQIAGRALRLLDELHHPPFRRELDNPVRGDERDIGAALDGHAARARLRAPELDHRGEREIEQVVAGDDEQVVVGQARPFDHEAHVGDRAQALLVRA